MNKSSSSARRKKVLAHPRAAIDEDLVLRCPTCGGPLPPEDHDRQCRGCRSVEGSVWGNRGRHEVLLPVRRGAHPPRRPRSTSFRNCPRFEVHAYRAFGHDRFTEETLRCLINLLQVDYCGNDRERVFKLRPAEVVQTLRRQRPEVAHSDDFRCVRWYGVEYTFSPQQAACVKLLYEHWERGTPEISADFLSETVECSKIADLFRNHPAWGVMVIAGKRKGNLRLAPAE